MKNFIMLVLLVCAAVAVYKHFNGPAGSSIPLLGPKSAPEISAASWLNTTGPLTLSGLKGKVVVVEFWATWCPPCRQSIPHLIDLYNRYYSKGVVIIGLTNEDIAAVKPFAKSMGINYPVGAGSMSGQAYGVSGIPHAFIIGKDGSIVWNGHPMSGLEAALINALQ